jgi:hypothetical protein
MIKPIQQQGPFWCYLFAEAEGALIIFFAEQIGRFFRDCPDIGGSCGYGNWRVGIVGWLESLSGARAENTIIDRATNLKE